MNAGKQLDTVKITLEHQPDIERLRESSGHELSSHAFASLFLWQEQMELSLYLREDFFTVKCGLFGENAWFFPCGEENAVCRFIDSQGADRSFSMVYLREHDVELLCRRFPGQWDVQRCEESDEYICDIPEFIALRGGKFSEIRRNLHKIDAAYDASFKPVTEETFDDAMAVISAWVNGKHNADSSGMTDDDVPETALRNRSRLDVSGSVLYLDQTPAAVFAGFPLTADTVDVLIGKCVKDAPRGTAYYALRGYLMSVQDKFKYCNHEEDLGIPGIRRMKTSLSPIRKNILWKAVRK